MTQQVTSKTYLLGQSEEEAKRLQHQARLVRDGTHLVFSQVNLSEGMTCLDVGCGAGDGMQLMGEFVGKTGKVTGLDIDGALGRRVANSLNATGDSTYEFIEGDIHTVESVEAAGYDLTFARFLLLHVVDPVKTIARMWELTKPGGYLVVMDYDFHTQGSYPPLQVVDQYTQFITDIFAVTHRDPRVGHKLPAYVSQVCGGQPTGSHAYARFFPIEEIGGLLSATYKSLLPAALKLGITTEYEAAEFLSKMDEARTSDAQFLSSMIVSAWKQKPIG